MDKESLIIDISLHNDDCLTNQSSMYSWAPYRLEDGCSGESFELEVYFIYLFLSDKIICGV